MKDILQFSIDVVDGVSGNEIRKILEDAGIVVKGISWKARWTEDGYDKGEAPISYD